MTGKRAYMAQQIRTRLAQGKTVLVVTLDGKVDGREWLARFEREVQ